MILTNYGADCAFCQIIFYYHTATMDFATSSNRTVHDFLKTTIPKVLIGFNNIHPAILKAGPFIIDTTRASGEYYRNYEKFITGVKTSRSSLFASAISADMNEVGKFCNIADQIATYKMDEGSKQINYLYEAMGHDSFVYRFISNPSLGLNKYEQQLIQIFRAEKEIMCKTLLEKDAYKDDKVLICRCPYSLSEIMQETAINKYDEDLNLTVFWDFTADGDIRVNTKSRGDLAGRFGEFFKGQNYNSNGSFNLKITTQDSGEAVRNIILDNYDKMIDESIRASYDRQQSNLEGYYTTDRDM